MHRLTVTQANTRRKKKKAMKNVSGNPARFSRGRFFLEPSHELFDIYYLNTFSKKCLL